MWQAITKADIEAMKTFCEAMRIFSPVVYKSLAYRVAIYRNVFRIGYEKKFTEAQYLKFLREVTSSKKIIQITFGRKHSDIMMAYKVMVDEILPKLK